MTGILCILMCAAFLYFEVSHRRLKKEVDRLATGKGEIPHGKARHLSPHRRAVDAKRRINQ